MSDMSYDYDVFISFASGDQEAVRPIWQDLTASGLRVFWSDSVLRERVGASWFDIIQNSLDRSRHFLLLCTPASLASIWVKREYVAFFNHCYRPPERVLVPVLASSADVNQLPLFLREVEACFVTDPHLLKRLVRAFGGVDVAGLQAQLAQRDQELLVLRQQRQVQATKVQELEQRVTLLSMKEQDATRMHDELLAVRSERDSLNERMARLQKQLDDQGQIHAELVRRHDELQNLRHEHDALLSEFNARLQPACVIPTDAVVDPQQERDGQGDNSMDMGTREIVLVAAAMVLLGILVGWLFLR